MGGGGQGRKGAAAEVALVVVQHCHQQQQQNPTSNGGKQNWKLSWNMYTMHTRFCTFGADLYAQSMIIKKNFCTGAHLEVYQECVAGRAAAAAPGGGEHDISHTLQSRLPEKEVVVEICNCNVNSL